MTDVAPLMSDDARALQAHFDVVLSGLKADNAGLRGIVETLAARVESHHTTQVTQIGSMANTLAEVKGDVKAQNGRVTRGETAMETVQHDIAAIRDRVSTLEGQRSGGTAMYTALFAVASLLLGAAGMFIARGG